MRRFLLLPLITIALSAQTGLPVAGFEDIDQFVGGLIAKYQLPGAQLAIARQGRLVYARGFGLADKEAGTAMQPDTLLRIASNSKPITAMAILKLTEQGKLRLDDGAFTILNQLQPPPGRTADARLRNITVRHLLQHTSGFPPNLVGDPMFPPESDKAASALGVPAPASCEQVIRYQIGQPLQADPGTRFAYSNFGFCVLGRIVEKLSGKTYEKFVQDELLAPLGITRTRSGKTKLADRVVGEGKYYMAARAAKVNSVFPGVGLVDAPYGAYYVESFDSLGGWMTTAVDLARIYSALDQRRAQPLLNATSYAEMTRRPAPPISVDAATWYGLGISVRPVGSEFNLFHTGSLAGTRSNIVRYSGDLVYAIIFNARPTNEDELGTELDSTMGSLLSKARVWPTADQFVLFYNSEKPAIATGGVLNGASYQAGAVAPGEILAIFGARLGPKAVTLGGFANGRLATQVGETRVLFDGVAAPIVYVSEGQISVIAPYEIAGKAQTEVRVETRGFPGDPLILKVAPAAPGLYTLNQAGFGPAVGFNQDGTLNSAENAAAAGEILVLFGTGEGQTSPAGVSGQIATTLFPKPVLPVRVTVGGEEAEVLYAGTPPSLVTGLLQLNVRLAPSTPKGRVPVVVQVGETKSPSNVTVEVK